MPNITDMQALNILAGYGDKLANELMTKVKTGKIKSAQTALSIYKADEKWRKKNNK